MKKDRIPGPVFALLSAVFFSTGGLFMKLISWNALALNSFRTIVAELAIYALLKATGHPIRITKAVLIGGFCTSATNTLYTFANKLTTAGNAIILQYTAPIFVMIWSALFLKQRAVRSDKISCAFVLGGVACFFVDSLTAGNALGNLLAVCSGAFYAVVFMMNSMEGGDPLCSVFLGNLVSIVIGFPFIFQEDLAGTAPGTWIAMIAMGIFQLGCGYIFLTLSLRTTPPLAACLISSLEAILNPIWVAIFTGEMLTPLSILGAVIVFVSITVYNASKIKKPDPPQQHSHGGGGGGSTMHMSSSGRSHGGHSGSF